MRAAAASPHGPPARARTRAPPRGPACRTARRAWAPAPGPGRRAAARGPDSPQGGPRGPASAPARSAGCRPRAPPPPLRAGLTSRTKRGQRAGSPSPSATAARRLQLQLGLGLRLRPCPPRAPGLHLPPARPLRPLSPRRYPSGLSWVRPAALQPNNTPPHRSGSSRTSKQHGPRLAVMVFGAGPGRRRAGPPLGRRRPDSARPRTPRGPALPAHCRGSGAAGRLGAACGRRALLRRPRCGRRPGGLCPRRQLARSRRLSVVVACRLWWSPSAGPVRGMLGRAFQMVPFASAGAGPLPARLACSSGRRTPTRSARPRAVSVQSPSRRARPQADPRARPARRDLWSLIRLDGRGCRQGPEPVLPPLEELASATFSPRELARPGHLPMTLEATRPAPSPTRPPR